MGMPNWRRSLCGQIVIFGMVGVIGFVINAGVVTWFAPSVGPMWAQIVAFPAAASVTWWLNRCYTFGASGLAMHREWGRYIVANSLGWLANNGLYFLLVIKSVLFYQYPVLAVAAGSLAGMVFNFLISKWVVFK